MNDKEFEVFIDKALSDFKTELLEIHALPILLIAAEPGKENAQVFQMCTKIIRCDEMIECLHTAIKNCHKEMLTNKVMKSGLN